MTSRGRRQMSKAGRAVDLPGTGRFAQMAGSSIAGRDAVAWITHFLNASYYGAPRETRELENLRTAWAVLTTYWYQLGGRRLGARHVRQFHHSFREARSRGSSQYPRGLLDRDQLERGAN